MSRNRRLNWKRGATRTMLLAGAIAPFAIANAIGAEADAAGKAQSETTIETIVVTAQRREENIQKTPISVTAFSADDLKAKSVVGFEDLAKSVPGLAISSGSMNAPNGALPIVYIRGIGQQDPSVFADPGVGVYVDGVYVARSAGASIALPDIQRIEVLRGPQGTLFGKNAVGGAINIVTQTPSAIPMGKFDFTTGSYNLMNMSGVASGPLADTVRGSIAYDFRHEDGYQNRLSYPDREVIARQGDQNHRALRGLLHIEPNNALTIDLSADYTRHRDTASPSSASFTGPSKWNNRWNQFVGSQPGKLPWTAAIVDTGDNYSTFATGPNFANNDIWGVSASIKWKMPWATFKSITAYRDAKEDFSHDSDASPAKYFEATGFHKLKQTSQEFQLLGNAFDNRLDWIAGLFLMKESADQQDLVLILPGLATASGIGGFDLSKIYDLSATTDSYAGYGQGTYRLTDKLSATVGLRYTSEKKSAVVSKFAPESGEVGVPPTSMSKTFSSTTSKFGLQYQVDPDILLFASATQGFKGGGFNGRADSPELVTSFLPEKVWSYEVGMKSLFFDKKLRLNMAAYSMTYKDMQLWGILTKPDGTQLNLMTNVASAKLYGAEIEATVLPIRGLELSASVAYNHNDYDEIQPGAQVVAGNKIPYAPRLAVSASAQYRFRLASGSSVTPRLDYSHRAATYAEVDNNPYSFLPAYGLLNGRITYRPANGSWSLSAYGTNLTNKFYLVSAGDSSPASLQDKLLGRPRMYGLTLGFEY